MQGVETPYEPADTERTWQSYAVRLDPSIDRSQLMSELLQDGVATRRGVMAIHHEQAYAGLNVLLPHTEAAAREVLMLPLFPGLPDEAQDYVVERLSVRIAVPAAA
jgi:dTDP-4-amino-4,6-dideoxygalactose transaminase